MALGNSRSRTGGSWRAIFRKLAIGLVGLGLVLALTVQTGAFSTIDADRITQLGTAGDQNAFVGIELADDISLPGGGGGGATSCTFGTNDLVIDHSQTSDVSTSQDVVVQGNPVTVNIDTDGCVKVTSGARLTGTVTAGGSVFVGSGARLNGDVTADGDVTVESGGMLTGNVDAGGDVTTESGARIIGLVSAGGDVTVDSGGQIDGDVDADGDVTVDSGGRILGDVEAGGSVSVGPGGRIEGTVTEGTGTSTPSGGGPQWLLTVTNNLDEVMTVTVTLQSPSDGTLSAGSATGTSVQFQLVPGASQDVIVTPTAQAGSAIEVEVAAETGGGFSVELERSVDTTGGP